ncbi:MAG: hypothetical protein JOZ18_11160 [Chloroflexi bacterium]|nr:hypothetical protein [Chloroflexota bacterium]
MVMLHAATDWLPRVLQVTQVGLQFWIVSTVLIWLLALCLSLLLRRSIAVDK